MAPVARGVKRYRGEIGGQALQDGLDTTEYRELPNRLSGGRVREISPRQAKAVPTAGPAATDDDDDDRSRQASRQAGQNTFLMLSGLPLAQSAY